MTAHAVGPGGRVLLLGRALAKRGVEKTLTSPPVLRALKRRARGWSVILAYHNVIPDHEELTGAHGAHVRLSDFHWQMDLLQEHCAVVPLDALLDPPDPSGSFRAALTFDDAYVGTMERALPELAERGLPATVFVPSGLVGQGAFWWDELGISGWEGERTPLDALRGETQAIRRWARDAGHTARPQGPSQVAATESQIVAWRDRPEVSFGVHTVGHRNLARLSSDEVSEELLQCRRWLEERDLPVSAWVSYPYGLTSNAVERVSAGAGFQAGMTITGGVVRGKLTDPFRTPRLIIPAGVTRENFLLRIFGVISS